MSSFSVRRNGRWDKMWPLCPHIAFTTVFIEGKVKVEVDPSSLSYL